MNITKVSFHLHSQQEAFYQLFTLIVILIPNRIVIWIGSTIFVVFIKNFQYSTIHQLVSVEHEICNAVENKINSFVKSAKNKQVVLTG